MVLDAERVVEALGLRRTPVQRRLATFEAGRNLSARALALGPRPAVLPPLPPMPRPTRFFGLLRARRGLEVVDLHLISSTVTRCGTRAIMPRISGRSGNASVEPILPQPEGAHRAPVFRLGSDLRPDERDLQLAHDAPPPCSPVRPSRGSRRSTIGHLGDVVLAPLALAVRVEHALGGDLFRRLAAQLGDLVGPAQRPQPLHRRARDVDRVRRTE